MAESATGAIKDKFLAGGAVVILLACYMALILKGVDTEFIKNTILVVLGTFVGLLKQTPSPQTNVTSDSQTTNVSTKSGE